MIRVAAASLSSDPASGEIKTHLLHCPLLHTLKVVADAENDGADQGQVKKLNDIAIGLSKFLSNTTCIW